MPPTKKITLKRSDCEAFDVDEAVALQSQTIKRMIEGDRADNGIPLSIVTGKILAKVIEDFKKMIGPRRAWDAEFVKVDQAVPPILCFSTGVEQLQFKQQSTYEFRNKVVNFGGHSPEDVSAALSSSDKKIMINMKEIMKRYQLFLANFEGKNFVCIRKKDSRNQIRFADPSTALLPASGGDHVKLFDVLEDTDNDLCMLSYSPSPGFHVNLVKWNHTSKYSHTHPRSSPAALQPGIESWLFM